MSFIKTFSGKHFYYDKINKDDIDINDIAVSLSNICRFAGHLSHFYSVAQHAVLCSQLVPQEFAFEALMHDATEAYCQDIPAPLKRLLPDYKRMEEKIDAVIREKYGLGMTRCQWNHVEHLCCRDAFQYRPEMPKAPEAGA